MQFEVGKIYYNPNGNSIKLECLAVVAGYPVMREVNCHNYEPFVSSINLAEWKEPKEPITVEGWVNVYDPPLRGLSSLHTTLAEAEETARIMCTSPDPYKLIATVYVKGTSNEP